ncbi:hypothetical protein HHK36_024414 [Tetracentron sinense]|uniref:Uncharacterized protein n=1 Tax=Tetracentron sinense TaxID=13715 RepID=A0A835D4L8_TETSI|nr:hypothetical protein HHK36_024414 [Tetracentron sinense]
MYGLSTLAHKPDCKSFEYNDNAMETGGLKAGNEIRREDQIGITCYLKSHNNGVDADPLPAQVHNGDGVENVPGLHGFIDVEDLTSDVENEAGDPVTQYINPFGDVELSEKETDLYTDKSVTGCELPELIVCFKGGAYHVVKDICIDEGVPSLETICIEKDEVDHRGLCSSLPSDVDGNSDLIKETEDTVSIIPDGMRSSEEDDCQKDVAHQCGSENLMQNDEGNFEAKEEKANDVSDEKTVPENMLFVRELDAENSHPKSSNFDCDEGEEQSDQDPSKEATSANPAVDSAAHELNSSGNTNEVPFSSKVESGSITFDFDSSTPATSGREESLENADCQPPLEHGMLDGLTASSRSFFNEHSHGESSFSAVGPLSGPIVYSGRIAYSGSISLRSDSSTTSTRSFAFPILHTEWNSSPVRMAKADRRHFRKHRGWRQGLLCCRF